MKKCILLNHGYIILEKENTMKITVIIATYNSKYSKILKTIDSVLIQENIEFDLIITEDSSNNEYYHKLKKYFSSKKFHNYQFVYNSVNKGTVRNLLNAIQNATGEYIKFIGPGDCLYSSIALETHCKIMYEQNSGLSFGEVYACNEQSIKVKRLYPWHLQPYVQQNKNKIAKDILLYGDGICGAAIVYEKKHIKKYLEILSENKVIYWEDSTQLLFVLDQMTISYIPEYVIKYEYGSGISTSDNEANKKKLRKDAMAFCDLLTKKYPDLNLDKIISKTKKCLSINYKTKNELRLKVLFIVPEYVVFCILKKIGFFNRNIKEL